MRKIQRKIKDESAHRQYRKKLSIRARVIGDTERPRLCVVKTNKHLSVQVVDDAISKTLFSVQTYGKSAVEGASKTVEGAKVLGKFTAEKLKEKGISTVVFDRNGLPYKGILSSFADAVRENGIKF